MAADKQNDVKFSPVDENKEKLPDGGLGLELQIIKESQQQHGLRGYCSRRLRRLRKTLGFKMGNRHKFIGKKVTVEILSDSYLLLVLMEAERAWSYAMQLKQEANTEPRKRFHLMARLRKAAKHSEKLAKLCESHRVDAKTKLEAQAYTAYLSGMVEFELQEWKRAMEAFNKCDQNAINDLMQMRLTGGGGGMMAEKLEALITQARTKQAVTMSEVEWRGRTVPVKIDKARIFLLGLADNEAAIAQTANEETKEHLYETLLAECRDTIQAVREELKSEAKQRERSSDADSGKVSNLQFLHYLTYIKLCTLVKRNESMAHTLQAKLKEPESDENKRGPRPQDLIRLYDIILQSLAELSTLQGLEDDHTFQKEVSLKTLVYKAYCFFIAQSYVLVKKWSEALVLYERVLKYAKEVQSKAKSLHNSLKFLQDLPDIQELIAKVNAEKYSLQAAAILTDETADVPSQQQVKDNTPLCDRLETFHLDPTLLGKQPNLVQFPPDFQPIPCKPLFFDLALNHVAFPPLDDKVEQKGKGGLTGYIKGIFGFGS
uniref:Signal recognition particle subunit SRP68 n=1 Tax=Monopterus albus TaxID=43700 RepID=A0A3Q3KRE2_MONAL